MDDRAVGLAELGLLRQAGARGWSIEVFDRADTPGVGVGVQAAALDERAQRAFNGVAFQCLGNVFWSEADQKSGGGAAASYGAS